MGKDSVDWDDPALVRWLGSVTRKGTRNVYKVAFRRYAEFTGLSASQLIDEALEDAKRDPRERRDLVKRRLIGFYNWLVEEAPKKRGGRNGGRVIGKGLSNKMAHTCVNAVRSFYATFDVYVKLKGRSRLPKPKVENKRMILDNVGVKKLVDHARSPRDRAIILTMFQSGMDVSTLCSLKYGDVAKGLKRGDHPLKLELYRPKTGTEYYTFLGKDACEALKAYLNDVEGRGIKMEAGDPLFLKESNKALSKEGITPNLVQNLMRILAVKSGFVDGNMNGRSINPLSPHALRESFGSIMTNNGVPDTIVDFWLGHEIGEMAEAYQRVQFEDLKRIYVEKEVFISISTGTKLEEKLRAEIAEKNKQLQTLMNGLVAENLDLKNQFNQLKLELTKLKKAIQEMKKAT